MKTLLRLAVCFALWFQTGCVAPNDGQDNVVVRAEQTLSMAFDTFDAFLKMEHQFREQTKEKLPEVHKFAEWLREPVRVTGTSGTMKPRGIALIESANNVKNSYKDNRSPESKATLISALAAVESALVETQKHLTRIQ
jgi:hypothetical protein